MEIQNHKRTLFVGGLSDQVSKKLLFGAFIPFGDIAQVDIAVNAGNNESKGFGFVEYEQAEDAIAAMNNMDDAELCGKVIHVKIAKAQAPTDRAIWHSQTYYEETQNEYEDKPQNHPIGPSL